MTSLGKKYLLFSILLCLTSSLYSQNPQIDSLKNELAIHKQKDAEKVDILNELAYQFHRIDPNLSLAYLEESGEITATLDYPKGKARGLYLRGIIQVLKSNFDQANLYIQDAIQVYDTSMHKKEFAQCYNILGLIASYKGSYQEAIAFFKESIRINAGLENGKGSPSALLNLGSLYADMGDYPESIAHYEEALEIYSEAEDQQGISKCLNNLGTVYSEQGNEPLALENYYKSYYLYQKVNDSLGISKSLNNIGSVFKKQGNYDKALNLYGQSLAIQQRRNNKSHVIRLNTNIGNVYFEKEAYPRALQYYEAALKSSQEIEDPDNESSAFNSIGDVYLALHDPKLARDNYKKAASINLEINDQHSLSNSYLGIAETYLAEQNYTQALSYTLKSKAITDQSKVRVQQSDVQNLLFNIYKATGKFEKALQSHESYQALKDSLFNEKNIEKMTQLEYEYKYKAELESARNRELQLTQTVFSTTQDLEKSRQNALIAIIVILLISLVSGGIIFYQKLKHAHAVNQNILIEQKLLRSQMTPHFIFNSLSVLQGIILSKEEDKSIAYLSKFSKLLRTILENSRRKAVPLQDELSAIVSYVELRNLDIDPPYRFRLEVEPLINEIAFQIPPMLIQPFIENAMEHAFRKKKEDRRIEVQLTYQDKRLVCTISDNGMGIAADLQKTHKNKNSLATTITSERLAMLSKHFKVEGSVSVKDKEMYGEQGTIVTLVIPYKIESVG